MTLDEAIKHAENVAKNYDCKCGQDHQQLAEWLKELKRYQSADAVEVIRCKDCKYSHMTYDGRCKYCDKWEEDGEALYLDGDFYCAYGERKNK